MMTLWILFCRINVHMDTLFPFYARDRGQAERKAEEFLKEHPSYVRLELKEYIYRSTALKPLNRGCMN